MHHLPLSFHSVSILHADSALPPLHNEYLCQSAFANQLFFLLAIIISSSSGTSELLFLFFAPLP